MYLRLGRIMAMENCTCPVCMSKFSDQDNAFSIEIRGECYECYDKLREIYQDANEMNYGVG